MILCCGEALIDMIPTPTASGGMAYAPHTGGAIFNTAIALGRLGADAALLSGVSTDGFGEMLVASLRANNVKTDHLIRSDRLTTLAIVHLTEGKAVYSFYDENSAGSAFAAADMPALPDDLTALYFGGISLVAEPAATAYEALMAQAAGRNTIVLDPNIRPGFITDEPAFRARLVRMIAKSDIVKVSDEDLDWIDQGGGSLTDRARRLCEAGPQFVVVTKGDKGATVVSRTAQLDSPALSAQVVDTVGAGDTFNAGLMLGLDRLGLLNKASLAAAQVPQLRPALTLGARAAAVTVSRAGANPPWASELDLSE
jgi:fructokinase